MAREEEVAEVREVRQESRHESRQEGRSFKKYEKTDRGDRGGDRRGGNRAGREDWDSAKKAEELAKAFAEEFAEEGEAAEPKAEKPVEKKVEAIEESSNQENQIAEHSHTENNPSENSSLDNTYSNSGGYHNNNSGEESNVKQIIANFYRRYKINEVLKRNQIVLVQVTKEERGNKGSSLTTYISLAGRFCVFMPNTSGSGGVSKRIDDWAERKRLKDLLKTIKVESKGSLILRTASIGSDESQIASDFSFLQKLWAKIGEKTMSSVAPSLIYEESNVVIRSIRDMYSNNLEQIVVEGEEAYKNAKEFIDALDPDSSKKVIKYNGEKPIFNNYKIDRQLDELYESQVSLPSGGTIVMAQTEALISVDVNSGKANRERSIEETAYKTNSEAAREIARQLKLRDLAGLVVIDFIDMRDVRNRKAVENELREALKKDRASTQVGRISMFGLLEMSRQRLRTNFFESNSVVCPHCKGSGFIRSHLTASVWILREVEARIAGGYVREIRTTVNMELGHYILNKLRGKINELERKYDAEILFIGSNRMILGNAEFVVTKKKSGDERSEVSTHQVDISKLYEEKSIENKAEHKKEEVVSTETSTLLEEDLGEQQPLSNERNDYNKPNYSNRSGSNDRGGDRGGRYQNNNKGGRRFDNRDNRGGDNRAGGENRGGQGGHGGQKENSFRPNNRNNNRGGDFGARPNNNSYSQYKNDYRNESKTYDNVPVNEPIANDSNLQNTPEDGKGDKEKSRLMGLWKKFTG